MNRTWLLISESVKFAQLMTLAIFLEFSLFVKFRPGSENFEQNGRASQLPDIDLQEQASIVLHNSPGKNWSYF